MNGDGLDERRVPGILVPERYQNLSPSRTQIVAWDFEDSVVLYDMDPSEKVELLSGIQAYYVNLKWSYDGRYISAVEFYRKPFRMDLVILDLESKEVVWSRQNVFTINHWSPVNNAFLVAFYDEQKEQDGWWFVNVKDGTVSRMKEDARFGGQFSALGFSPDGQKLVTVPWSVERLGRLAIYDLNGQQWQELLPDIDFEYYEVGEVVQWSPDGQKILYTATYQTSGEESRSSRLFVANLVAGKHQLLVDEHRVLQAFWSPDSKEILFNEATGDPDTFKVSVETGEITLLDDYPGKVGKLLAWVWEAY